MKKAKTNVVTNNKQAMKKTKTSNKVVMTADIAMLNEINRKLKKGEKIVLAEKTGFSASHVTNVLAGRRTNSSIVKAANTLTRRRK